MDSPTPNTIDFSYIALVGDGDFEWSLHIGYEAVALGLDPEENDTPAYTSEKEFSTYLGPIGTIDSLSDGTVYAFKPYYKNVFGNECPPPSNSPNKIAYGTTGDWATGITAPTNLNVEVIGHKVNISWDADLDEDALAEFHLFVHYDNCTEPVSQTRRLAAGVPGDGSGSFPLFVHTTTDADPPVTTSVAEFSTTYPEGVVNATEDFFNGYSDDERGTLTDGTSTSDVCVCVESTVGRACSESVTITYVEGVPPADPTDLIGVVVGEIMWVDWMDG